jgi:8-oxo-dGTP pyrophosphatase MutT (NUDIX family)
VKREVEEETGIPARVVCSLGVVTIMREGLTYAIHEHLLAPLVDREPAAGDDARDARWVPCSALSAMGVRADALDVIAHGIREARVRHLAVDGERPSPPPGRA